MAGQLAERGISQRVGAKAERVEAGRVVLADGSEEPFDLLLAVPPHRPPAVVADSGLVAGQRLDRRRPGTLATSARGRLRGRRCQPDPARERAAAAEGRRDGRAAGAARRPRDRGRAARRASRRRRSTAAATARSRSARTPRRSFRATGMRSPSRSCGSRGRARRSRPRSMASRASTWSAGSAVEPRRIAGRWGPRGLW